MLPRLARTQKGRVFVQLCIGAETLPALALGGVVMPGKIVQFYAKL
ncbi:hypothetical protein; putative exported protein [Xenorhabdus bovienii str. Jollieti]|uniref:Uncharacterized protein n=1 Tax=Xenorhabdus bovienii (strain SS-2004) TaxID=406818 RepID=D3V7V8_XENBS|nr:hypothetical protein; putative exported protein [Xenorhabdus bovienii SS-2004]CDH27763.1 hypothetical protein; putative exported protein [Xenorhabdus bovienii str. Jollieti]